MKKYNNYSVLMSVYYKENADYLRESMNSIWNQTVPTDDFVLVCDGPLGEELNDVIREMKTKHYNELHVYRLKENRGLGIALNIGLKKCRNELVARMDSDDVSVFDRCENQLEIFNALNVDIVSGTVEEFVDNINNIYSFREVPEYDNEIKMFLRRRNPFNHPCVMYKKQCVIDAGGYKDFYLLEDYFLWVRMLSKGCKGYNIQNPILHMRAGDKMYLRRSGILYAQSQKRLFSYMYRIGIINRFEYYYSVLGRMLCAVIPNSLRKNIYFVILRSR